MVRQTTKAKITAHQVGLKAAAIIPSKPSEATEQLRKPAPAAPAQTPPFFTGYGRKARRARRAAEEETKRGPGKQKKPLGSRPSRENEGADDHAAGFNGVHGLSQSQSQKVPVAQEATAAGALRVTDLILCGIEEQEAAEAASRGVYCHTCALYEAAVEPGADVVAHVEAAFHDIQSRKEAMKEENTRLRRLLTGPWGSLKLQMGSVLALGCDGVVLLRFVLAWRELAGVLRRREEGHTDLRQISHEVQRRRLLEARQLSEEECRMYEEGWMKRLQTRSLAHKGRLSDLEAESTRHHQDLDHKIAVALKHLDVLQKQNVELEQRRVSAERVLLRCLWPLVPHDRGIREGDVCNAVLDAVCALETTADADTLAHLRKFAVSFLQEADPPCCVRHSAPFLPPQAGGVVAASSPAERRGFGGAETSPSLGRDDIASGSFPFNTPRHDGSYSASISKYSTPCAATGSPARPHSLTSSKVQDATAIGTPTMSERTRSPGASTVRKARLQASPLEPRKPTRRPREPHPRVLALLLGDKEKGPDQSSLARTKRIVTQVPDSDPQADVTGTKVRGEVDDAYAPYSQQEMKSERPALSSQSPPPVGSTLRRDVPKRMLKEDETTILSSPLHVDGQSSASNVDIDNGTNFASLQNTGSLRDKKTDGKLSDSSTSPPSLPERSLPASDPPSLQHPALSAEFERGLAEPTLQHYKQEQHFRTLQSTHALLERDFLPSSRGDPRDLMTTSCSASTQYQLPTAQDEKDLPSSSSLVCLAKGSEPNIANPGSAPWPTTGLGLGQSRLLLSESRTVSSSSRSLSPSQARMLVGPRSDAGLTQEQPLQPRCHLAHAHSSPRLLGKLSQSSVQRSRPSRSGRSVVRTPSPPTSSPPSPDVLGAVVPISCRRLVGGVGDVSSPLSSALVVSRSSPRLLAGLSGGAAGAAGAPPSSPPSGPLPASAPHPRSTCSTPNMLEERWSGSPPAAVVGACVTDLATAPSFANSALDVQPKGLPPRPLVGSSPSSSSLQSGVAVPNGGSASLHEGTAVAQPHPVMAVPVAATPLQVSTMVAHAPTGRSAPGAWYTKNSSARVAASADGAGGSRSVGASLPAGFGLAAGPVPKSLPYLHHQVSMMRSGPLPSTHFGRGVQNTSTSVLESEGLPDAGYMPSPLLGHRIQPGHFMLPSCSMHGQVVHMPPKK